MVTITTAEAKIPYTYQQPADYDKKLNTLEDLIWQLNNRPQWDAYYRQAKEKQAQAIADELGIKISYSNTSAQLSDSERLRSTQQQRLSSLINYLLSSSPTSPAPRSPCPRPGSGSARPSDPHGLTPSPCPP